MPSHSHNIRIYYEDTDAGGVVYHASYVRFAERGRTEFLRHLGYQNSELSKDLGILFVVRHVESDFLKPGFLDDFLRLETTILEIKKSSFVMRQSFFRQNHVEKSEDDFICDIKVTIVCVDAKALKAVRLPDELKAEFETYMD